MFVGELDIDDIVAGLGGSVCDPTRPVLIVLTVNVSLRRPLYRQTQASIACQSHTGYQLPHSQ